MIGLTNAFCPYIGGPGLLVGIDDGVVLIGTTPTFIAGQIVSVAANATNYIQLNTSSGSVQVNTTGFGAGDYPIAIVTTGLTYIEAVVDSRPDVYEGGSGGGGGLLAPTAYSANANVASSVVYGQATAGAGGITLTLQSTLLTIGQAQLFMKMDSAAGAVMLTDSAGATFNSLSGWAETSWLLVNQGEYANCVWDGTRYTVFGS